MKNQNKSMRFAAGSILLWSTVATAFKTALQYLSPLQLLFTASAASTLILLAVKLYRDRASFITLNDLLKSIPAGFLNPFLYYLVLFKAYDLLPAQIAQPLNYTWPVTLAIIAVPVLGEKLSVSSIGALFVSFTGVVLIASQGSLEAFQNVNLPGVLLALASSVIWALYWAFSTKDKRKALDKLLCNFISGTIFILILMFIQGESFVMPLKGVTAGIYAGLFEMGLTFLLWQKALQYAENTALTGNLVFLAPFISLIFISLFLNETITPATISGLFFIIAGVFLQRFFSGKKRAGDKPRL